MSEEETQPEPLRLRPRLRPESTPSSRPPDPEPPVEPAAPDASGPDDLPASRPRLRAKPRLAADSEDDGARDGEPGSAPDATPSSAESTPVKLRLQTSQPASMPPPLPPAAPSDPFPPPVPVEPSAPPLPSPPPVMPPPVSDAAGGEPAESLPLRPPDHIVPHLRAPQPVSEIEAQIRASLPPPPPPPPRKRSPMKAMLIVLGVLLVIVAGFWFAGRMIYDHFFMAEPTPAVAPAPATTLPGKLIEETVEARRAREQARIDSVIDGGDSVATGDAEAAPTPVAVAPIDGVDSSGDGTVAKPAAEPEKPMAVAPVASAQFLAFVDGAVIGGVFQGEPARAFINGRTVRSGELVSERLGIVFVGLDDTRRNLIFRDDTGAEVVRKF